MEHWIQMVSQGTGAEGTSTMPSKSQMEGEKEKKNIRRKEYLHLNANKLTIYYTLLGISRS